MSANVKQQEVLGKVLEMSETGGILNVIGEGGTGKSWLIEMIDFGYPNVKVTATTGIAAKTIGGQTIHSYLGLQAAMNDDAEVMSEAITFEGDSRVGDDNCILIVDESSMMGTRLFEKVLKTKFKLLILFGDKQQLRPVKDKAVDYTEYHTVELTEQMRTKSSAYNLIKDYRAAKEIEETLDVFKYVDGDSVEHIDISDLNEHYHQNQFKDKRVVTYTNAWAEAAIEEIGCIEPFYQLHSPVTVYDGAENKVLAVNGEVVEVAESFDTWKEAQAYYRWVYNDANCQHRTSFKNNYPFEVHRVALKGVKTHFVRLLIDDKDLYTQTKQNLYNQVCVERDRLQYHYGEEWKDHKDEDYNWAVRGFMDISNNIVVARHVSGTTAHKVQGQSVECVYIMMDEMENRKSLMYVALSRAIHKIVLVTGGKD